MFAPAMIKKYYIKDLFSFRHWNSFLYINYPVKLNSLARGKIFHLGKISSYLKNLKTSTCFVDHIITYNVVAINT